MVRTMRTLVSAAGVTALAILLVAANSPKSQSISLDELHDRIEGGWAGQMIGVASAHPLNSAIAKDDRRRPAEVDT